MPVEEMFASWASWEGVPSAVAAARDGVDALLRDRGLRRTTPELTAESLLRGARASAALEKPGADQDRIVEAAVRLNTTLLSQLPIIRRSPLQALARLHAVAAAGQLPDDELGRPRASGDAAAGLQALGRALLASAGVPGIVVAAGTHAELHRLAPFASHNGLIARAVERLLLVERGVDPTSMIVVEAGHQAAGPEYAAALASWSAGTEIGQRDWLLYAARAIIGGVEASPLRPSVDG